MAKSKVLELVLYVEDVAAAARFLETTAGLAVLQRDPGFTVLDGGGVRLALRPQTSWTSSHAGNPLDARAAGTGAGGELVLDSDDVDRDAADARAAGAATLMAPVSLGYGRAATLLAPGGLRVTLFRRAPTQSR